MRSIILVLACVACACDGPTGGQDGGGRDGGPLPDGTILRHDSGPRVDAGGGAPVGALRSDLRVDNFGWRTSDVKIAVLLGHAGAPVELRHAGDNALIGTYTASSTQHDDDSGDDYALVDFSEVTSPGDYYLYMPSDDARSYPFRIADDVYDVVGAVAMKSFYFQRCNHDRALPHASDAMAEYASVGQWVDGVCHATDSSAPAGPGSADHGALDVHGGWHDAGDYQKTLWARGVPQMLFAYEVRPSTWTDGHLNIPESGNGIPDILDELRWELDFYIRMQRPDGHFMTSVKGRAPDSGAVASPPSASNEGRVYFDSTSPSGDGWSGGGVTIEQATGNATLSLAHAAIVFRAIGQGATADGYAAAARAGWTWLASRSLAGEEQHLQVAAAAAIHRMDPSITSASSVLDAFAWSTWDDSIDSATPADNVLTAGAWHVLLDATANASTQAAVRTGVSRVVIDAAFEEEGAYGGMRGGIGNGWDYSWGSNRAAASYGANLMMARHLGVLGTHTDADLMARAEKQLHYLLGLNPMSMVYFTNMAAYGGEHSSFQLYHGWFSVNGADGDHENPVYNGRPTWVDEPLYPYYPDDNQTSMYGPAPGLLVGGPNYYYSCSYDIPNRDRPAYAYRDFAVGCDWDGAQCRACSWEITEPDDGYQGPAIFLLSFFMSGG